MAKGKNKTTIRYEDEIEKKDEYTESEKELIKNIRAYEGRDLPEFVKRVWAQVDDVQVQVDGIRHAISLNIQKVRDFDLDILRNDVQLRSGDVYKHIQGYPDQKYTRLELESENRAYRLHIKASIHTIKMNLAKLIKYLNSRRIDREHVLTEQQFESYVKDVDAELRDIRPEYGIL